MVPGENAGCLVKLEFAWIIISLLLMVHTYIKKKKRFPWYSDLSGRPILLRCPLSQHLAALLWGDAHVRAGAQNHCYFDEKCLLTGQPETHLEKFNYCVCRRFRCLMQTAFQATGHSGEASWLPRRPRLGPSEALGPSAHKQQRAECYSAAYMRRSFTHSSLMDIKRKTILH